MPSIYKYDGLDKSAVVSLQPKYSSATTTLITRSFLTTLFQVVGT